MDIGGQPRFWGLWETGIMESDCILFVIDGSDYNKMTTCKALLQGIKHHSILYIVTKCDLENSLHLTQIVKLLELQDCLVYTASAATGMNIDLIERWLVQQ